MGLEAVFQAVPDGTRLYDQTLRWETVEDPQGRRILEIDPASSFGTGSHDTTQLCMMALEDAVKPGDKLLDMGTGSGILAIAAAMLGADVQTIVDIDENCLKTAHENAEKNHVEIGRGLCGDALRDPKLAEDIGDGYDVIVANIVADVIIGMSPMFADKLVKGGTLICSGILNERARRCARRWKRADLRFLRTRRAMTGALLLRKSDLFQDSRNVHLPNGCFFAKIGKVI